MVAHKKQDGACASGMPSITHRFMFGCFCVFLYPFIKRSLSFMIVRHSWIFAITVWMLLMRNWGILMRNWGISQIIPTEALSGTFQIFFAVGHWMLTRGNVGEDVGNAAENWSV